MSEVEKREVKEVKEATKVTPGRCFLGASISGSLAVALYFLTVSIATAFGNKALPTVNMVAVKIAIAVRTLVLGVSVLGTGIFALVTLGLIALGIQVAIQGLKQDSI